MKSASSKRLSDATKRAKSKSDIGVGGEQELEARGRIPPPTHTFSNVQISEKSRATPINLDLH